MGRKTIAVIDCSIEVASHQCFDELAARFDEYQWHYFHPVKNSLKELEQKNAQRPFNFFISLGSASNVEDRLAWQQELAVFLDSQLCEQRPVLGICFSHQLMIDYYGGVIRKIGADYYGTRSVKLVKEWNSLKVGKSLDLTVAHSQEVDVLPDCFQVVASSPQCRYEIVAHKKWPFIGVQAHPEASSFFLQDNILSKNITISDKDFMRASRDGLSLIDLFLTDPQIFVKNTYPSQSC